MTAALPSTGFRRITARGLNFRVFDQGQGVPVLLLHGFPDSLNVWDAVIPHLLAAGYRVIAHDQRGFGETDAPAGESQYLIDEIVADIPAVLDALGVDEPTHVIGHDWGAGVAWAYAGAFPHRVRSLVAVSVGHPRSYGRAGLEQKLVKGAYVLWFQLRGLAEWYLLRAGGLHRWLGGANDSRAVMADMSRPGRLRAGLSWYRANVLRILFGKWTKVTRPTLGIWSSGDIYLTEEQMTASSRNVDAAWQYRRVDGCSHWIPLEQPQKLAELALAWFREHPGH